MGKWSLLATRCVHEEKHHRQGPQICNPVAYEAVKKCKEYVLFIIYIWAVVALPSDIYSSLKPHVRFKDSPK